MGQPRIKNRLHWLCWQPTPYNDYLFMSLSNDPEIDLIVHYRERVLDSHPWQTKMAATYKARFYRCILGIDWNVVFLPFREKDSFIVVAGWDHATSIILLTILGLLRGRFAVWTDTPNMRRKRNPVFSSFRSQWLKWVFCRATKVMGTGRPAVDALKAMGAPKNKIINFPFFLDLDLFERKQSSFDINASQSIRVVSSGRIVNSVKGHDIVLQALALAGQKKVRLPFEYIIAGTGPDQTALQTLSLELGIDKNVRFLGWVEPDELIGIYVRANILIHPSPLHDPFPNAILEGMAAGLTVLASDTCGSAIDRIKNGVNGFIHPAGDVEVLAEQIEFLFKNPNKIAEIGRRARKTAEQWPVERGIKIIKEMLCAAS